MRMLRKTVIRQALENIDRICCRMENYSDYQLVADNLNTVWNEIKDRDWFSSVAMAGAKEDDRNV